MSEDAKSLPKLPKPETEQPKEIPIAARIKGPGPSAYCLPSTLGRKAQIKGPRAPAFSISGKYKEPKKSTDIVPGPNKFFPQSTRVGIAKGPAFSIQGGFKKKEWANLPNYTPAPNNYNPMEAQEKHVHPPAFSMQPRREFKNTNVNPGPTEYNISEKIIRNRNPSYTMQPRRPMKVEDASPGPQKYDTNNLSKLKKISPKYSFGARLPIDTTPRIPLKVTRGDDAPQKSGEKGNARDKDKGISAPVVKYGPTPSPADYALGDSTATRNKKVGFSFRVKHSEYESFVPDMV